MQITVVLRNETPIHSSAPIKSTISTDGVIGAPNGIPFTRMRTLRVVVESPDGLLRTEHLPCVPGNSMRNLLRRSALNTIFGQLRGHASLDIGAYAAACTGSASGNPEGVRAGFDETVSIRKHVFLGLFGGGPRMIKGRLSVDSMYPIVKQASRLIGEGYEERMISGPILDVVWMRRVDPIETIDVEEDAALIKDAPSAITAWSVNNEKNRSKARRKGKDAESEEGADARGLNAFNAHEVVVPGVDWVWNIHLDNPTEAQVGLVLKAIHDIAKNRMQIAGGHAKDYGKVSIQDISIDGSSVWGPLVPRSSFESYLDALAEALDALSANDFMDFVKPSKAA